VSEVDNSGVRISYETFGQGRPLVLLHGFSVDRTWWREAGFIDLLRRDHRLVNVDMRGHGQSDGPHDPQAYSAGNLVGDVLAVADAEGLDRFAVWGLSMGGWIAWMTAAAVPSRVAAIVASGAWDPRPIDEVEPDYKVESDERVKALQSGGTMAMVQQMDVEYDGEIPRWAQEVALRSDPEALLAAYMQMWADGIDGKQLTSFPVPTLLIAGELEDPDDEATEIAAKIPNGECLRLAGLGHPGACAASTLSVPTVRAFLNRWLPDAAESR
jgi:pimeloyl-ACP methyl ester carboxylesterase